MTINEPPVKTRFLTLLSILLYATITNCTFQTDPSSKSAPPQSNTPSSNSSHVTTKNQEESSCVGKNIFLGIAHQSKSLTVLSSIHYDENPNYCRNEWNVYGSCCDVNSVQAYIKKDRLEVNSFVGFLKKELNLTMRSSSDVLTRLEEIITSQRKGILHQFLKEKGRSMDYSAWRFAGWRDQVNLQQERLGKVVKKFERSMKSCSHEMNRLRSASLCSFCSSRAEKYFYKNKAIIDMETCDEHIEYCFRSWVLFRRLERSIRKLGMVLLEMKKADLSLGVPLVTGKLLQSVNKWFKSANISKSIKEECTSKIEGCPNQTKVHLCERSLNLVHPTFIHFFKYLVNSTQSKNVSNKMKNAKKTISRIISTTNSSNITYSQKSKLQRTSNRLEKYKLAKNFIKKLRKSTLSGWSLPSLGRILQMGETRTDEDITIFNSTHKELGLIAVNKWIHFDEMDFDFKYLHMEKLPPLNPMIFNMPIDDIMGP